MRLWPWIRKRRFLLEIKYLYSVLLPSPLRSDPWRKKVLSKKDERQTRRIKQSRVWHSSNHEGGQQTHFTFTVCTVWHGCSSAATQRWTLLQLILESEFLECVRRWIWPLYCKCQSINHGTTVTVLPKFVFFKCQAIHQWLKMDRGFRPRQSLSLSPRLQLSVQPALFRKHHAGSFLLVSAHWAAGSLRRQRREAKHEPMFKACFCYINML